MNWLQVIGTLIVLGFAWWAVDTLKFISDAIKPVIKIVLAAIALIVLLKMFGMLPTQPILR